METLLLSQVIAQLKELALPETTDTNIVSLAASGVRLHVECNAKPKALRDLEDEIDSFRSENRVLEEQNDKLSDQIELLKVQLEEKKK